MCVNILKIISSQCKNEVIPEEEEKDENDGEKKDVGSEKQEKENSGNSSEKKDSDSGKTEEFTCTNPECTRSRPGVASGNLCVHAKERLEKEKEANSENKENKPKDKTPDVVKPTESAKPPCRFLFLREREF